MTIPRRRGRSTTHEISEALAEQLRRYIRMTAAKRDGSNPLFIDSRCGPRIHERSLRRRLKLHLHEAQLAETISFHDLRMSGVAIRLLAGEKREAIASRFVVPLPSVNEVRALIRSASSNTGG